MDEKMMTRKEALSHLDEHVKYPATKQDITQACNMMADVPEEDKTWLMASLPEATYSSSEEVKKALGLMSV